MQNKLKDQQKIEIVEKYLTGQYTCAALGREYGIARSGINGILKRRNVKINSLSKSHRTYTINENFFDKIDGEIKAYLLGLLYADGCNSAKIGRLAITLQEEDKHILERFNLEINSNRPLVYYTLNKKNPNHKNVYKLIISNKHMSAQLAKIGCVQAKSLILEFPSEDVLPLYLVRHFIRGYFDGDGCFTFTKRKESKYNYNKPNQYQWTLSIVSTSIFCDKIQNIIKDKFNTTCSIVKNPEKYKGDTVVLKKSGKDALQIMDWLYLDMKIGLTRKYEKAQFIKGLYEEIGQPISPKVGFHKYI